MIRIFEFIKKHKGKIFLIIFVLGWIVAGFLGYSEWRWKLKNAIIVPPLVELGFAAFVSLMYVWFVRIIWGRGQEKSVNTKSRCKRIIAMILVWVPISSFLYFALHTGWLAAAFVPLIIPAWLAFMFLASEGGSSSGEGTDPMSWV